MNLQSLDISTQKANQFHSKNIYSCEDLLRFFPRSYKDFSKITGILPENELSCFEARVENLKSSYSTQRPYLMASCRTMDAYGKEIIVSVFWFHQTYLYNQIYEMIGEKVVIGGKVKHNGNNRMVVMQPDLFERKSCMTSGIIPVYSKIKGMSTEYLTEHIRKAMGYHELRAETLPEKIVKREKFLPFSQTLSFLHCPSSMEQVRDASERILMDDLIYYAMHNILAAENNPKNSLFIPNRYLVDKIIQNLPFSLTKDQQSTVEALLETAENGNRINSLIQGDVGCGKTIVAILLMSAFVGAGYQAAIMTPTQILARQHYQDLCALIEPLGYHAAYLGSDMTKREMNKAEKEIASGKAQFVVGTTALIKKNLAFQNLAIVITDEEHRFGVIQREMIAQKSAEGVHCISMSATPIPRSLAGSLLYNLSQMYTIKTKPEGRLPVITGISRDKNKLFSFIVKQAQKKHQIYVVCPMIEESNSEQFEDVASVNEINEEYRRALEPHGVKIATLTGKDKKTVATQTMTDFKDGKFDVLIATTAIEIGVNVPTAVAMVIVNAERFGLASLHQLRGRVGRGNLQGYCVLVTSQETGRSIERLETLCETADGYKIAQADLENRGAGDFLGIKQAGRFRYVEMMMKYPQRYEIAEKIAKEIIGNKMSCPMLTRVQEERAEKELKKNLSA